MEAPLSRFGQLSARIVIPLLAIGVLAWALRWATVLEFNTALAVAGGAAILVSGWLALSGTKAPDEIGAPQIAMSGFMGNSLANQGAMMIQQEAALSEQSQFDAARARHSEPPAPAPTESRLGRSFALATLVAGAIALVACPFV